MPYPNEHSARLQDPKKFDPKTYRRTNGGTIYGKIKVPATIAIIWGKLKGKSRPSDPPIPQALRFPTKNWTTDKAKKWLKDNGVKYQSFEPAAKEKEKQSMSEQSVGKNACVFNADDICNVQFAEAEGEKNNFKIIGYSGGIIKDHWYWGDTAFDLEGIKFAKAKTPVLEEHFSSRRIGFTTKQEISDKVVVEGEFLKNDTARQIAGDLKQGFPMEGSLYIPPSVVEHVEKGQRVKVNGLTLKGPGAVFRKATIKEVSMCVFGADSNTRSSAYADNDNQKVQFTLVKENNTMEIEEMTVEMFVEARPDLHQEIFEAGRAEGKTEGKAEGEKARQDLFAELQKACGKDHELLVQCFSEGKSPAEAMQLRSEKLEQEKSQLSAKVAELQKQKIDPAKTEFTDGAVFQQTTKFDETTATDEQLKQHFQQTQELQDEFHDVESYLAYVKREVRK